MVGLSQNEADYLLKVAKIYIEGKKLEFPSLGGRLEIPLISNDTKECFKLDINRNKIEIKKNTFQNREKSNFILARLDLGGPPHRNPDGEEIPCPHLHLYREGLNDKYAIPLPEEFVTCSTIVDFFYSFLSYCNITIEPKIDIGLFVQ